jgi:hypothetical protein
MATRVHHVTHDRASETPRSTSDQNLAEARERLQRFAIAWHAEYVQPGPLALAIGDRTLVWQPPTLDDELLAPGLDEAAFLTLRAVQADLLALNSPVEKRTALRIMRDRRLALTALLERGAPKRTKEQHLYLTDGEPLTICMGEAHAIRGANWKKKTAPVKRVGDVGFTVIGCLSIFPDCTRTTGGNMWPWFCEECRSDKRNRPRDQGREVSKRYAPRNLDRDATVYYASAFRLTDDAGDLTHE